MGMSMTDKTSPERGMGYFGEVGSQNLGDEAVYEVLQSGCSPGRPVVPIISGSDLKSSSRQRQLQRYTSIVIGGGTQFTGMNAGQLKTLVRCNDRIWSFGTGVGSCGFSEPPDSDLSGLACSLKHIHPLTVRGPYSREKLLELQIYSEIIGDPALAHARESHLAGGGRKILVNLLQPMDAEESNLYRSYLANLASCLVFFRKKGWEIAFVALGPGDAAYINTFKTTYDFADSGTDEVYASVPRFFELLEKVSLIISMRLHGAILACCVGVPFLLCNYRPKCADFAASVHHQELLLEPTAMATEMMASMDSILCRRQKISRAIHQQALYFREKQLAFLAQQCFRS